MITKFEKTGFFNARSGRGRNSIPQEEIKKNALQVEKDEASNVHACASVRRVTEAVDMPPSTIQNIMRNILRYYPYKLQLAQNLLPNSFKILHLFSQKFLSCA